MKYVNEVQGYNSRLDPIQAAILQVKLKYLDDWNARRAAIARQYIEGVGATGLILPVVPDFAAPAWHLFVIRHPQRDALQSKLVEAGINTLIHYPIPPHRQAAYASHSFADDAFPIASRSARQVLSLPVGSHQTEDQTRRVIEALAECCC